ncbi:hypothetical protein HDU79_011853 [Rhizoclosmatium sp. JEL0117]|nr:hypothetical protein HDU79_011853 [Rhizoclosmatium sp. JEL0117]
MLASLIISLALVTSVFGEETVLRARDGSPVILKPLLPPVTGFPISAYYCSGHKELYQLTYVTTTKVDWVLLNTCPDGQKCVVDLVGGKGVGCFPIETNAMKLDIPVVFLVLATTITSALPAAVTTAVPAVSGPLKIDPGYVRPVLPSVQAYGDRYCAGNDLYQVNYVDAKRTLGWVLTQQCRSTTTCKVDKTKGIYGCVSGSSKSG